MTPKEKAKELVCDFYAIQSNEYNYAIDWKMAKKCALLVVDEILDLNLGLSNCDENNWAIEKFYTEVKQEIDKL
jgi:hypothetical protein